LRAFLDGTRADLSKEEIDQYMAVTTTKSAKTTNNWEHVCRLMRECWSS